MKIQFSNRFSIPTTKQGVSIQQINISVIIPVLNYEMQLIKCFIPFSGSNFQRLLSNY